MPQKNINQIVILDAYTTQPGDLSWDRLQAIAPVTAHERTPADQTVARAQGANCLITNKTVLNEEVISQLPDLKYIGLLSTGINVVDVTYAASCGITVTNVPGYGTDSVAQHVFAMLLTLTNRIQRHSDSVHQGDWQSSIDFGYTLSPITELAGLTMGLVGYGNIARQVARLALAFGMKVKVLNQRSGGRSYSDAELKIDGMRDSDVIEGVNWDVLLRESDVISLHCPLTPETEHLFNAQKLCAMKEGSILINTGRGPLIDEDALAEHLKQGPLGGAGLDVLSQEPPQNPHPLIGGAPHLANCIITPHNAWASRAARSRMIDIATDNLISWQTGEYTNNQVN